MQVRWTSTHICSEVARASTVGCMCAQWESIYVGADFEKILQVSHHMPSCDVGFFYLHLHSCPGLHASTTITTAWCCTLHYCDSTCHHCDHTTSWSTLKVDHISSQPQGQLEVDFQSLRQSNLHQIIWMICILHPHHILFHLLTPILIQVTAAPATEHAWSTSKTHQHLISWWVGYTSQIPNWILPYVTSLSCFATLVPITVLPVMHVLSTPTCQVHVPDRPLAVSWCQWLWHTQIQHLTPPHKINQRCGHLLQVHAYAGSKQVMNQVVFQQWDLLVVQVSSCFIYGLLKYLVSWQVA